MRLIDVTGQRFGKLIAVRRQHKRHGQRPTWLCNCDCGGKKKVQGSSLRNGSTTSCGCAWTRNRKRPFEALYNRLRAASAKRGIVNTITYKQFVKLTTQEECHYCLIPIIWSRYNGCGSYNLDRKNNARGYTNRNVAVCCKRCNKGKLNLFSYKEWFAMTEVFRRGT